MMQNQTLWWQRGIVYQVYLRSFMDSNNDGIGDLGGIIARLDYLAWLGVNAIWISPMYPSPMADFGYDITNFTNIDPLFGDLTTFDELLQQCHQRGIKVIIDFVPNHTSDQHPWFLASRASRDNPKRDWYTWADAKSDSSPPNNWLSVLGGSAWEWDPSTSQYYLHSFLKEQPDLNWRNEEVKTAMFDVLRFWLERGVDGFRIDAVYFIMKDPQLRDNPPNTSGKWTFHKSFGDYDTQIHLHDKTHPDLHTVLRELRSLLDSYSTKSPRVVIGEMHIFDWKEWATYFGPHLDELHLPFNFGFLSTAWEAQPIRQIVDKIEASLLPGALPCYVLGNHDEPRIVSRVGAMQARIGMMLLLTLHGTPTIYYGDEIGMHDVDIPLEHLQDPLAKNTSTHLGRDPERTPMQWNSSPHAGFCPPATSPWLPIADDYKQINLANQHNDPHSMLTLTQSLIKLRNKTPALNAGSYHSIENGPETCFIYLRQFGSQRRLIALNFSQDEQKVALPELGKGQIAISTYLDRQGSIDLTFLDLRSWEGCIIEL